jgi:hypothetical protein
MIEKKKPKANRTNDNKLAEYYIAKWYRGCFIRYICYHSDYSFTRSFLSEIRGHDLPTTQ